MVDRTPYTYRNNPPINKHNDVNDMHQIAKKFGDTVKKYLYSKPEHESNSIENIEVPPSMKKSPLGLREMVKGLNRATWKKDYQQWVGKAEASVEIAENIGFSQNADLSFDYRVGDTPVSQMKLKIEDKKLVVTWLTSHPGTSGGGQTMMEKAANVSQDNGLNGILHVTPRDSSVLDFYKSLGFKGNMSGMQLDPSREDQWAFRDGKWIIKGNIDKGYLSEAQGGV